MSRSPRTVRGGDVLVAVAKPFQDDEDIAAPKVPCMGTDWGRAASLAGLTPITVKIREYRAECLVPRPRSEVFAFFANPGNLAVLTPPWVRVDIPKGGPTSGYAGMEFGYRVWLHGLPMPWPDVS